MEHPPSSDGGRTECGPAAGAGRRSHTRNGGSWIQRLLARLLGLGASSIWPRASRIGRRMGICWLAWSYWPGYWEISSDQRAPV
jgi:hypothetical protein